MQNFVDNSGYQRKSAIIYEKQRKMFNNINNINNNNNNK